MRPRRYSTPMTPAPSTFVTHALEQPSCLARSARSLAWPQSSICWKREARCATVSLAFWGVGSDGSGPPAGHGRRLRRPHRLPHLLRVPRPPRPHLLHLLQGRHPQGLLRPLRPEHGEEARHLRGRCRVPAGDRGAPSYRATVAVPGGGPGVALPALLAVVFAFRLRLWPSCRARARTAPPLAVPRLRLWARLATLSAPR